MMTRDLPTSARIVGAKFVWIDEACDYLREMHAHGISDSRMARALSERFGAHVSRNAVIGKRHRLKPDTLITIKNHQRRSPGASIRPVRVSDGQRLEMREQAHIEEVRSKVPLPFQCTPVSWLEREGCSWPIDQSGGGLLYCNNAVLSRAPYCAHHYDAAHRRDPTPKSESNMRRFTSTGQFR